MPILHIYFPLLPHNLAKCPHSQSRQSAAYYPDDAFLLFALVTLYCDLDLYHCSPAAQAVKKSPINCKIWPKV